MTETKTKSTYPTISQSSASVLSDAGESYAYLKTIVNNEIEIKKLQALSAAGSTAGTIGLIWLFGLFTSLLLMVVTGGIALGVYFLTQSMLYAFLAAMAFPILSMILLYAFRKILIFDRIALSINQYIENN